MWSRTSTSQSAFELVADCALCGHVPQLPRVPLSWWLTLLTFDQSFAETHTVSSYTRHL